MGKIFFGLFPNLNNFYTVSVLPYFVNMGRKQTEQSLQLCSYDI